MLRHRLAHLKEQRDEESHLVRRRKAQRGPAVPLVPHGAKLRTPLRTTSFLGSVRHLAGRNESYRQTRILYTCFFKANISSFLWHWKALLMLQSIWAYFSPSYASLFPTWWNFYLADFSVCYLFHVTVYEGTKVMSLWILKAQIHQIVSIVVLLLFFFIFYFSTQVWWDCQNNSSIDIIANLLLP